MPLRDILPHGWSVVKRPPSILDDSLVGQSIAGRWGGTGWAIGVISKHFKRAQGPSKWNYITSYNGEDFNGRLDLEHYNTHDNAPEESWCIVEPSPSSSSLSLSRQLPPR